MSSLTDSRWLQVGYDERICVCGFDILAFLSELTKIATVVQLYIDFLHS